ncbi:MAG: hypothetical protein U5L03_09310 [Burkholderiaceae bacterium]|nr:hypothetical protein [Burkholderiaceae bacterium]
MPSITATWAPVAAICSRSQSKAAIGSMALACLSVQRVTGRAGIEHEQPGRERCEVNAEHGGEARCRRDRHQAESHQLQEQARGDARRAAQKQARRAAMHTATVNAISDLPLPPWPASKVA